MVEDMEKRRIKLNTNELKVTISPNELYTRGIGSCVAIAIYDYRAKAGGMAHISMPEKTDDAPEENLHKYAGHAVDALVRIMERSIPPGTGYMGGGINNPGKMSFSAKITGGANMFQKIITADQDVGRMNVEAVIRGLLEHRIPLVGKDVLGYLARSMYFDLCTGMVTVVQHGGTTICF